MSNCIRLKPSNLAGLFKKYLSDESYIFVFSTDVVMNSWIDWCVSHEEESGVSAVALERFVSWDKFKGAYVSASEKGKSPVPSLLRKFFIRDLIQKNQQELFFTKIINPEYADSASSFTDWLCKMLPSLSLWHKLQQKAAKNADFKQDEEDKDYEILYERYKSFLDANNFFEPAWVSPDFSGSGKKILLIYPETLEDFADYLELFAACPDITMVMLPEEEEKHPVCYKYPDSRKELRMTILRIRRLVEEKKAEWKDISLSVPDLETYRPYLERELTNYCVPFVIRAGFPLTKNCAGVIFKEILDCYNSNFSYDSVRALLLDNYIPWKEQHTKLKESLIREGQRLRCICSYDSEEGKSIDIWKEALSQTGRDELELAFYNTLKKNISAICKSTSFKAIHTAWMAFKSQYLEAGEFSETADKIISRCISELNTLISIEEKYCQPLDFRLEDPYSFFINELSLKSYTPQSSATGISVFPYKLSAAAAFKYQFVIDASQANLEIPFKRLSFLNARKRGLLKLTEEDQNFNASKAFIRLYAKSEEAAKLEEAGPVFSCAEDTFSGFAIAHTYLTIIEKDKAEAQLEKSDFIQNENRWFLADNCSSPFLFSEFQKKQFERWISLNNRKEEAASYTLPEKLKKQISYLLIENRNQGSSLQEKKITLSQTDMKKFFACPRRWIFSDVLKLKKESLSTSLTGPYDMGNIHHKIMELYGSYLMQKNLPLPHADSEGNLENEVEVTELIKGFAEKAIHETKEDFSKSPLTMKMLESQLPAITRTIINFLKSFCDRFGGYKVKGVEKWYNGKNPKRSWNYTGKIDCILVGGNEHPEDNGWTIIDYKNTPASFPAVKDAIINEEGKLKDFQMPMYITLMRENEKVQDITRASFYAIKPSSASKKSDIVGGRTIKSQEEYEDSLKAFEKQAEYFAECVQKSEFPLTEVDPFEDCGGCDFKSICRYTYTIAGRTK